MPKPTVSKYVTTQGAGFVINSGEIFYGPTYTLNQKFIERVYITVEFENPSNPKKPYIVKQYIPVGVTAFSPNSPKFKAIRNNTNYKVVLKLYNNDKYTGLFATHIDHVRFSAHPEMFEILGITQIKN